MENNDPIVPKQGWIKYFTKTVIILISVGVVFVILGAMDAPHYFFPSYIPVYSPFVPILKSLGSALFGSGVFTAIIKSSEYTKIFSDVMYQIVWTKKYIERRTDKIEIWSAISRLIYEEKFPDISDEMENIITGVYFPTKHQYYLEDYEIMFNIKNHSGFFDTHQETISFTLKPTDSDTKITYVSKTAIDLPSDAVEDHTNFDLDELIVNGEIIRDLSILQINNPTEKIYQYELPLHKSSEYKIVIKRSKTMCRKTNPDKRLFALSIIKNMKVECMAEEAINIAFSKMGTINEYTKTLETINNGVRYWRWEYRGLILPQQGFIALFK